MFDELRIELNFDSNRDDSERIVVDDIVEVATRDRRPVLSSAMRFDALANLRILGENRRGAVTEYLALVTAGDEDHVLPTLTVERCLLRDYDVDPRFHGENALLLSELFVRRIVQRQRGRFCQRCEDYNRDVRMEHDEVYFCLSCKNNPYR